MNVHAHGSALEAAERVLDQPHLRLAGLHCHLGSQITDIEPFLVAAERLVGACSDGCASGTG